MPPYPRRSPKLPGRLASTVAALSLAACAETPPTSEVEQPLYSDVSGAGPLDGIEWQIDAPWRIEPRSATDLTYGPIPLVVTFHDAAIELGDPVDGRPRLETFCGLYVVEGQEVTWIAPGQFHEIEASKRWLTTGEFTPGPDTHMVRRMWAGESPDDVIHIARWAEWHGVAMYQPRHPTPGSTLKLITIARTTRGTTCGPPPSMSYDNALWQVQGGRDTNGGYAPEATPPSSGPLDLNAPEHYWNEFLQVHLAPAPLPRFGDEWVYGDLHYHSQGTDNEGESAVSFRAVLQAMKAMGMDYLFATDHASNSHQITGFYQIFINAIPELPGWLEELVIDLVLEPLQEAGAGFPVPTSDALRDMSPYRFAYLFDWLNGESGANAEVGASPGPARQPRIFLGGEVDAIPEISDTERRGGAFTYAFDRVYAWSLVCNMLPAFFLDHVDYEDWASCGGRLVTTGSSVSTFAVRDPQGLGTLAASRQHLVYLPYFSNEPGAVTGRNAFVASNTTIYGGANRTLRSILSEDLARDRKGYVFLAHPIDASSGDGIDRLGPDMVPYSDAQLEVAFASPYVLGLQLWNSDIRRESWSTSGAFPLMFGYGVPDPELPRRLDGPVALPWEWQDLAVPDTLVSLNLGARMWDQLLRWSITPARTGALPWLPAGTPRKVFMAGGSDAHGDLNYRRLGRALGLSGANDTAIGRPRNLTYVAGRAADAPVSQNQVIDALRSGQFAVTDGPALRIVIDRNENGVVDAGDVPMGGDHGVGASGAPVLIEWKSTPEFGAVESIDLYVGVSADSHAGLVYAPGGHGSAGSGTCARTPMVGVTGRHLCPLADGYVRDPGTALRVNVPVAHGLGGVATVRLQPSDYPLFEESCWLETVEHERSDGTRYTTQEPRCNPINERAPSRLFVRAVARTFRNDRLAYTNPIWMTAAQPASPPVATLTQTSCADNVATMATDVRAGVVPGTVTAEYRVGTSTTWTALTVPTASLQVPGGTAIELRARVCNPVGCSAEVHVLGGATTCIPPPPSAPWVQVEFVRCASGTNSFAVSASPQGSIPATSMPVEYQIGSGAWLPAPSVVYAGSGQRVTARARSCSQWGCSGYASSSALGPTCRVGGGGGGGGGF